MARLNESSGDEIVGLTRSFLYAGTPTLWNIAGQTSDELTAAFNQHRLAGLPTAQTPRQAQLDMLEKNAHPFRWAAFTLRGDGSEVIGTASITVR